MGPPLIAHRADDSCKRIIACRRVHIRSPVRTSTTGRKTGGVPISRGHLYWILSNPIYIGRLRHKGQIHDGLHQAIIDWETWQDVQHSLAAQTQSRRAPCPTIIPSSRASSSTIAETGWARAMLPRPDAVGDTMCRAPRYRDASKRLGRSRASRLQRSKTAFRARSGSNLASHASARPRTIISIATSAAAMSRARSANAHQQTRHLGRIFETPSTGSRSVRPGSRSSSASPSSVKGRIDY